MHTYISLCLFVWACIELTHAQFNANVLIQKQSGDHLVRVDAHGKGKRKMSRKVQVALNSMAICAPIYQKQTYNTYKNIHKHIHIDKSMYVVYITTSQLQQKVCLYEATCLLTRRFKFNNSKSSMSMSTKFL